jgi:PKD repeat protein
VTNPPSADFFTSTRYGSAPFTVSFSDSSRGREPFTYLWEFGDGATSDRKNPSHTYKSPGEYDVRLTVTNIYASDTKTVPAYIGVGDAPVAGFITSAGAGTAPLSVLFTDASRNRPTAWAWDFGDGTTSAEMNPSHTYAAPGTYTVRFSVSNHFGTDEVVKAGLVQVAAPAPVPAVAPAVPVEKKPEGIYGLILAAKGTTAKNLPASGVIPPQFMALAAVLTSLAVLLVQFIAMHIGVLWQFLLKFVKFFADLLGGHAVEKLSDKEIEARRITVRKLEPRFLGLSSTEILVIEAAVVMVALAFLLADRADLTLTTVLIYMAVGAVSVVLHDFAHRYVMTRHGYDADTRFWGLGTAIMFLTAWLFGNAFAQSYRNLASREGEPEPRELGIEMAAGPLLSIVLTFVFLGMVSLGGIWAFAGGIGFTINLMTAVYSLMPIETMDGLAIWRWDRRVYLALFIPMFAFYLFTYIMVT